MSRPEDDEPQQEPDPRRVAEQLGQVAGEVGEALGEVAQQVGASLGEAMEQVAEGLSRGLQRPSAARRLLAEYERRAKGWRQHSRAYAVVVPGLVLFNVVFAISAKRFVPWSINVAIAWGIGLGIHALSWRGWLGRNRKALVDARDAVALEDAEREERRGGRSAAPRGLDRHWTDLLRRAEAAVSAAQAALLAAKQAHAHVPDDLPARLDSGLAQVRTLAAGVASLDRAMAAVLPDGSAALDGQLRAVEDRIAAARTDELRHVLERNRKLLLARKGKVEALLDERERLEARAEGFVLAAENIRLDATRLRSGAADALDQDPLAEPLAKLAEEVTILREVERELAALLAPE